MDPVTVADHPFAIQLTSSQRDRLMAAKLRISKKRVERGKELVLRGAVHDVALADSADDDILTILAKVEGNASQPYDVAVEILPSRVDVTCDCMDIEVCKHAYAVIQTLVNDASSGARASEPVTSNKIAKAPVSLGGRLEETLGRKLVAHERDYVSRIEAAYRNVRGRMEVSVWDMAGLLPSQFGGGWTVLKMWPKPPASVTEFWLYVARAIEARGLAYPDFMKSITDFTAIQDDVRDWLRSRDVEEWRHRLEEIQQIPIETATLHLRLRIDTSGLTLESRLDGDTEFIPFRTKLARTTQTQIESGQLTLGETSAVVWQYIASFVLNNIGLQYGGPGVNEVLGRMLRVPFLRGNFVAFDGAPLEFSTESLRWDVSTSEESSTDYDMQLVTAEGVPPLKILTVLPGKPTLYLTARAVYPGPPASAQLPVTGRIRVPAEAVETREGAQALAVLQAPFPEKLKQRIETVPLRLQITAGVVEGQFHAQDMVNMEIHSLFPDGARYEKFIVDHWAGVRVTGRPKSQAEKPGTIRLVDRSRLGVASRIFAELPGQWSAAAGEFILRITRKFPEQFADWLKNLPPEIDLQLDKALASFQADPLTARFNLEVIEAGVDWFDVRTALSIEETDLTMEEINLLLKAGGKYVRLGAKGWRRLAYQLSPEDDAALAHLGLSAADLNGETQRLHVLQLSTEKARKFLLEADVARLERRVSEIRTAVRPDVPATIQAKLRPYQIEGFHFLAYLAENRFGGILADDMGLGKTIQTLTWIAWLREQPGNIGSRVLVICPKSVTDNWASETARFYPELRAASWRGREREKLLAHIREHDVTILNYAQLRTHETVLQGVDWLAVILDEGQFIKNPSSQTAQAARGLRADHRLVLTGTPVENRLMDLWSLMSFAMPGVLGNQAKFNELFNEKKDTLATRRLASRVRPFLLRRTKKEVATDLPDRVEEDLHCEMEGAQLTRYRGELKVARQKLLKIKTAQQLDKDRFNILTSLLRLRQICAHPGLADAELTDVASAKEDALFDLLEPLIEEGHKVLVFSQFVAMLDRLREKVDGRRWRSFYLAGATEERGKLVDQFQSCEGGAVFLISLRAGGFGLNLTSASYVVLYDPWWNPAVESQAIDRTHRIGQVNKVIAYRLITRDSIEEKIRNLQKSKGALAQDILGEENFVKTLTLEDFQFLFGDT
ncbi:MAG TPA: DEAD/DEAH box helicase [Chthoniobacterales bacterium]